MTVCDQYPGLTAEIVVDHRPLKEYEDDEAEPGAISRYVEAASGKEFSMRFTFTRPFPTEHGVEICVSVDGEQSRVLSYSPEELYRPEGHYKRGVGFQKDGQWYRQNYRFTALNIGKMMNINMIQPADALEVEEADGSSDVADLRNDLQSKGSIKMEFRFITNMRDSNRPHTNTNIAILPVMGNIPEKALKGDARSHQATYVRVSGLIDMKLNKHSLGKPRLARERKPRMKYTYVNQQPFATMHFKYRSLGKLRSIIFIGLLLKPGNA
jgi:hypothetical protein